MKDMKEFKRDHLLPRIEPAPVAPPAPVLLLQCVGCYLGAKIMYEGTSWCQTCWEEKMRTGR